MSNPLLRPNDPRFQKPSLADETGRSRFAEESAASDPPSPGEEAGHAGNVFAAGSEAAPYRPRYEVTQRGRSGLLLFLASLGLLGILGGTLHLLGIFGTGSLAPAMALVPAMAAWYLAHSDLEAIRQGAMDESHRPATRLAWWIAVLGFLGSASLLATMIYQQLDILPSTF
jgi:hypothetical protein